MLTTRATVLALPVALLFGSYVDAKPMPPPKDDPGGQLMVLAVGGEAPTEPLEFPLKHTDVDVHISGYVASVEVRQTYLNPFDEPIEAVYTFPLPDDAAVNAMTMKIGEREIIGQIKTREDARKTYEEAKAAGHTAALLDQERPNIFTQQVANIMPGQRIDITIRYVAVVKYDDGGYELNFPTVVGPRYIPGDALPAAPTGTGWAPDTTDVSDASKITPPVLKPGERSGHDIAINVKLDAGLAIHDIESPSHDIEVVRWGRPTARINLKPADRIPNKDFILRWSVAGKRPESAVLATKPPKKKNGYVTIMIQPQAELEADWITPKEMIFVVDTSGSMRGAPMEKAKELMRRAIGQMNPDDSFQILDFDDTVSKMSPEPLPNTEENRERALAYVNGFTGSGGTRMLSGIEAALAPEEDENRLRIVVFITDGYIGNEAAILDRIQKKRGGARIFAFGVGSSVNHYLLDRMSVEGRGFKQYVRPDEDTEKVVSMFYGRIANPLLTDIEIDWGDLDVKDQIPAAIPDLFSAQPVFVHARYRKAGSGTVKVRGRIAGKPFVQDIRVELPASNADHQAIGSVWARARIEELERDQYGGEKPAVKKQITALALEHGLMSRYTSFVAVEHKVVRDPRTGKPRKVVQPVELPEGVDYEGVFGDDGDARRTRSSSGGGKRAYKKAPPAKNYYAPGAGGGGGNGSGTGRGYGAVGGVAPASPEPVADRAEEAPKELSRPKPEPSKRVTATGFAGASGSDRRALVTATSSLQSRLRGGETGLIVVDLTVAADGRVTGVNLSRDTVGDARVEKLVKLVFRRVKLDKGSSERKVRLVLRFQ